MSLSSKISQSLLAHAAKTAKNVNKNDKFEEKGGLGKDFKGKGAEDQDQDGDPLPRRKKGKK